MLQVGERLIQEWIFIDKLSALQKSSCCQAQNPHRTVPTVIDSHIHKTVYTSEAVRQLSHSPNMRQFINKINASFRWTVVSTSPQQDRAHGSDIIIEFQLDSQQKCALRGDWSLYSPLSCLWKSRDQRENRSLIDSLMKQPSQGFLMEMSICCFMQSPLSKSSRRVCEFLDKGLFREINWQMLAQKLRLIVCHCHLCFKERVSTFFLTMSIVYTSCNLVFITFIKLFNSSQ